MTISCWDQDPARRPTMTGVVGFLLEWPVFPFSVKLSFLYASCSYTLQAINPSSSTLAPWRPARKADDGTNHPLISPTSANVESAASQQSSPREVPGNLNPMPNVPRPGDSENTCGSFCKQFSDKSRAPSDSGDSDVRSRCRRPS